MKLALRWALAMVLALVGPASAQKNYPGVTDTEIKIGQTMPYSGPLSAYATIGKAETAFFDMINEQGGINGRKIQLLSRDDGYSPPKTVEQIRSLVEQDQVAFIFNSLGTPTNTAIHKYLNERQVPQLFVATGANKWNDPQHFPWTMGWQPNYQTEARIYASYVLKNKPNARVAVLYQNDDFGKDYLQGLRDGLGDRYDKMVVMATSYEVSDPTIDSQVIQLHASGADTLVDVASPKFAAQAIRKVFDIGWKPLHILANVSGSIASVLSPAGLDKSVGIISTGFLKDPNDPQWQRDPGFLEWRAWMAKYYPSGDLADSANVVGYLLGQTLVHVLTQCGEDLSRENIMRQAASLHEVALPMLLPGIKINTTASDFRPIKQMQMAKFDGQKWELFGEVMSEAR